jgi:hypothetical protein
MVLWLQYDGQMRGAWLCWLVLGAACNDTQVVKPVGGSVDSEASVERYVRRATLDLSGTPPSDTDLTASGQALRGQGNTATARGTFVDGLLAAPAYPTVWVEELENSIFGGNTLEQQYTFVCSIVRGSTQDCLSCTQTDSCACACPEIVPLATERTQLRASATDLAGGTPSSTLERRYALASGYFALSGTPEARVGSLFTDFLARTAEDDEIQNGRAMVIGSIISGSPAGLMFHREGATYGDLIDIIFTSEVYREAVVRRVFLRYLSREPSAAELAHFVTVLDANAPDARPIVRAVVSSREYFEQ